MKWQSSNPLSLSSTRETNKFVDLGGELATNGLIQRFPKKKKREESCMFEKRRWSGGGNSIFPWRDRGPSHGL